MAKKSIIWKDIPRYEGIYQVSNFGNVKSLERDVIVYHKNGNIIQKSIFHKNERILKENLKKTGYTEVILYKNGKREYISLHRLVAKLFIPNPNNFETVNHKDENKRNNCVENLEWLSQKDNNNYGTRNKRISEYRKANQFAGKNPSAVKVINKTTGEIFDSVVSAANAYNCSPGTISNSCNPLDRHHKYLIKGCHWEWLKPVSE